MDIGRAKHHSKSPSWAEHLKDAFYEGLSQFMYVSRHSCEQWLRYMMLNGQWMNGHWTLTKERVLAVQTNNEHCTKIHFGPSAEEFVPLDKLSQHEEPFVLNFMYWAISSSRGVAVSWRILGCPLSWRKGLWVSKRSKTRAFLCT